MASAVTVTVDISFMLSSLFKVAVTVAVPGLRAVITVPFKYNTLGSLTDSVTAEASDAVAVTSILDHSDIVISLSIKFNVTFSGCLFFVQAIKHPINSAIIQISAIDTSPLKPFFIIIFSFKKQAYYIDYRL